MDIKINFSKTIGKIKPMHAVGQPPFSGTSFDMFKYLTDAGIPYSRLHDVGGAYGGGRWVDIPNIFRDFDADETLPDSYDFAFTDLLINALVEAGVEPFFRLGVTIENAAKIKSYRISPPKDFAKWARICEHIIRHYTEGWADGFYHKITYWEIWNEPDNFENPEDNQMWSGTPEEYYELYSVTAKHLKGCFPHLKIGGYASCGFYDIIEQAKPVAEAKSTPRLRYFIDFFDGFIAYIKKSGAPLDFFSWHSYDTAKENILYARYARERLDAAGFTSTETTCNEWNARPTEKGTFRHAALTSAVMLAFQNTPLDSAMFYDARCGIGNYSGMFNPETRKPRPAYYSFIAFNELYELGEQAELSSEFKEGVYAVAARNEKRGALVIANTSGEDLPISITADGAKLFECRITTEGECDRRCLMPGVLKNDSTLTVRFELK